MHSYHPQEIKDINKEITHEWVIGLGSLNNQHSSLFNGTLEDKLKSNHKTKLRWLTTVWTLRELQHPEYLSQAMEQSDPMTRYRYLRWKLHL